MFCKIFLGVPGAGKRAILFLLGAPMVSFYTINAKTFKGLCPKRRESSNGDQVYVILLSFVMYVPLPIVSRCWNDCWNDYTVATVWYEM